MADPQADAMEDVIDPNLGPVQPQADTVEGVTVPKISLRDFLGDPIEAAIRGEPIPKSSNRNPFGNSLGNPLRNPLADVETFERSWPIRPVARPSNKRKLQSSNSSVGEPAISHQPVSFGTPGATSQPVFFGTPGDTSQPVSFGTPGSTSQSYTFSAMPASEQTPFMLQYAEAQALHGKDLHQALKEAIKAKEQAFKDRDAWKTDCVKTQILAKESQTESTEIREQLVECDRNRIKFANALELMKKDRAKLIEERDSARSAVANLKEGKAEEIAWSNLQEYTELMDRQRQEGGMVDEEVMGIIRDYRREIEGFEKRIRDYQEHVAKMYQVHAEELEEVRASCKSELHEARRQAQARLVTKLAGQRHDILEEQTRLMVTKNRQHKHLEEQIRICEERLAKQAGDLSIARAQMTDAKKEEIAGYELKIRDQKTILIKQRKALKNLKRKQKRGAKAQKEQRDDAIRRMQIGITETVSRIQKLESENATLRDEAQGKSTLDQQQKMEVESDDEEDEAMKKDLQRVAAHTRLWSEKERLRELNQHLLAEIQNHKNEHEQTKQNAFLEIQKHQSENEELNRKL
ncbi:MAG: hypothetical protein Q9214_007003, partial [Letrouitia sp. 1 TL-2023]